MTFKKIATAVHVEIEPDQYTQRQADHAPNYEKAAEILRTWAREIEAFFRDHRSQDINGLNVVVTYKWVCGFCEDETDTPTYPTCCDAAREEWEAKQPPKRIWGRPYSYERGDKR